MKNLKILLTAISFIATLATSSFAAEEKYTVESSHTSVTWSANHFGFSKPSGKFTDIAGEIKFDEKNPKASAVEVIIKTASINTGIIKFDEHLKSKDFFDVTNFPTAKFVSTKIVVVGKNKAKITGDLTLLGVTKPVVLDATFNKSGINPVNQKQTIGFSANAKFNRSDFGINYAVPGVADEVVLAIELEANR